MKTVKKIKTKKQKTIKSSIVKPKKEHVLIVAQEIKFARLLSGNEKTTRDRVLRTLKKWLLNCFQKGYEFKEDDFIRVWKGLFYAVWMSDKPLVQEELCENIASILDQFPPEQVRYAFLMVKAGLRILATEWYGIDQHRMDKFLMLVRRYLRGGLRCLLRCEWSMESCQMFSEMLSASDGILSVKTPHYARNATSMILHLVDCFLEELAKVSSGELPDTSLVELLRPFCRYMCAGEVRTVCVAARRLMTGLVRQSEAGLRYADKITAWKMMGCPRGGPEALELQSDDDDDGDETQNGDEHADDGDESQQPLDPRAGRVDVELPCLPVPATKIAGLLREMLASASSKTYRRIKISLERFEKLANNEYPLPEVDVYNDEESSSLRPTRAAKQLRIVERQLVAEADELALRGLSRKHRKRLLAKTRAGGSIVEEVAQITNGSPSTYTNGDWKVETTDSNAEKDSSNKENVNKISKKRKLDPRYSTDRVKKQKTIEKNVIVNKVKDGKRKTGSDSGANGKEVKKQAQIRLTNKVQKLNKHKNDKRKRGFEETVKNILNDKSTSKIDILRSKNVKATKMAERNKEATVNGVAEKSSKAEKLASKQEKIQVNGSKGEKATNKQDKILENSNKVEKVTNKQDKILNNCCKVETSTNKQDKVLENVSKVDKSTSKQEKILENGNKTEKTTNKQQKSVENVRKIEKQAERKQVNNRKVIMMKSRSFEKLTSPNEKKNESLQKKIYSTPKKVKFVLKNNSMQGTVDYYKSVRQSPNIPYDSSKKPIKTNLKPSTPSPINPFFKKKWKLRK